MAKAYHSNDIFHKNIANFKKFLDVKSFIVKFYLMQSTQMNMGIFSASFLFSSQLIYKLHIIVRTNSNTKAELSTVISKQKSLYIPKI